MGDRIAELVNVLDHQDGKFTILVSDDPIADVVINVLVQHETSAQQ
jgi:hypothetical protein